MSEFKKPDYSSSDYCSPSRMASYGYQIKEVISQNPKTVLEIGIGNGICTYLLRRANINVTTLDLDNQVKPDVVGSVLELPFESNAFHGVLCCQVLEHLPFDKFAQALRELWRVTSDFTVLSLPDVSRHYYIDVALPKVGFSISRDVQWRPHDHIFDGEHHWEIGKRGYLLPKVLASMREAGFTPMRHYRIWELPYFRFFVLAKTLTPNQSVPILTCAK
jgi:ubiquinone/menaquinone biosynthesis C-methylase UbiE